MKRALLILAVLSLVSCAESENKPKTKEERLKEIERKIQHLNEEIKAAEKKAMNQEIESENAFRSDYTKFANQLENSEKEEQRAHELQKEVNDLENEKKHISE